MTADDADTVPTRPTLTVVRGEPSPEELAALTAVVAAAGGGDGEPESRVRRGGWSDPAMVQRRTITPGPNAWRSSYR